MINIRYFLLLFALCAVCIQSPAQTNQELNELALRQELEKRNLVYEEVVQRLLEEGYDIDSLDINTLSEEDQQRIEDILTEMSRNSAEIAQPVKEQKDNAIITVEPEESPSQLPENTAETLPPAEIYGQDLFRNGIINLIQNSNQLKVPESYVLGQGDQIVVSIWGRSQLEASYTIQSDGFIRLVEGRVRVFVKGLTVAQARKKIRNVLSSEYSFGQGEFDIAVNYTRTVRVSIYGEVMRSPGSYTVSGFNSALNVLSLVGGPNNIGSLRNIKLQKSSGKSIAVDVYAFMRNPALQSEYYLEDNDIILIPVSDKVVNLRGAIRRPFKYELRSNEGLKDLIGFAGGFSENAYQKKIQIKRFINNEERIIDVDWSEINDDDTDFQLYNGDEIYVESIEQAFRNFVSITGELNKPGQYQRTSGMRVLDLVQKAELTPNSNLDIIYLIRTQTDGTKELLKLNLQDMMDDASSAQNLVLQDLDKVEVWSQERFADEAYVAVSGAVRYNGNFPYDQSGTVRVTDAITLAGGLRRDASDYAIIHFNDPLNQNRIYYKTIDNLKALFDNPEAEENFVLNPFDSLVVQSINTLEEKQFVRIEGAINQPGTFQYGENMTIKDLLVMAGGFVNAASTNNIEVSRVIIQDNEPTNVVVANLEMTRDFEVLTKGVADGEYRLEPFDNVSVRFIKDFDLQDRVFISGEVNIPGPYVLSEDNQRISSIIERAGGLTVEAFPQGATLLRNDQDLGPIVIKLDEILENPRSDFNFILRDGDRISIPKINEFVAIKGATRVKEVVIDDQISEYNLIRVPFHEGKDALFYIEQFAGGFDENADRSKVFVEYANGEIKYARPGIFKRKFPKVRKGSMITVGYKTPEDPNAPENQTDWSKVLSDSVGQALSILTLILLVQRID